MACSTLLTLLLVAAPESAAPTQRPRLLVVDITSSSDVEPAIARALTDAVAVSANRTGLFEVSTQGELSTLLGVERQKQLLGCAESSSSCSAELAGALGAQFLATGNVARLGAQTLQLSLQVQDTTSGSTVGRAVRIASDIASLRDQVPAAFADASATPPPPEGSRVIPTSLLVGGGLATVSGAALLLQAALLETAVATELRVGRERPDVAIKPAAEYRVQLETVTTLRVAGIIAASLGAAGLLGGVLLWPGRLSVAIAPQAGGLSIAGVF